MTTTFEQEVAADPMAFGLEGEAKAPSLADRLRNAARSSTAQKWAIGIQVATEATLWVGAVSYGVMYVIYGQWIYLVTGGILLAVYYGSRNDRKLEHILRDLHQVLA